jgi:hypothetical protein
VTGMEPDQKELQMSQQAQIDALEHLVIALFKELDSRSKIPIAPIINAARASVFDSEGSGGPAQKAEAAEYLEHLGFRLSRTHL